MNDAEFTIRSLGHSTCVRGRREVGAVGVLLAMMLTHNPAAADGATKAPVLPKVRFVVVEMEKAVNTSPALNPVRSKIEKKRVALEQRLKTTSPTPTADVREQLVADAMNELAAYMTTLQGEMRAALASSLAPKAKASTLDFVLDVTAAPAFRPTNDQLEEKGPFASDDIWSCRALRLDLNAVATQTKLGQKWRSKEEASLNGLEVTALVKRERPEDVRRRIAIDTAGGFAREIARLAAQTLSNEDTVCVLEHRALSDGLGVAYAAKKGGHAKVADATAWVVANLDDWQDVEQRGGPVAVAKHEAEMALVGAWVDAMGPLIATWRGAKIDSPPAGFTAAWTSKRAFGDFNDVVVGLDASNGPRARILLGRQMSLEAARKLYEDTHLLIIQWSSKTPWDNARLPANVLMEGYVEADMWARPIDPNSTTKIWRSIEGYKERGPGTILLSIEPDGDAFKVVLDFAAAALRPPLKPELLPE